MHIDKIGKIVYALLRKNSMILKNYSSSDVIFCKNYISSNMNVYRLLSYMVNECEEFDYTAVYDDVIMEALYTTFGDDNSFFTILYAGKILQCNKYFYRSDYSYSYHDERFFTLSYDGKEIFNQEEINLVASVYEVKSEALANEKHLIENIKLENARKEFSTL